MELIAIVTGLAALQVFMFAFQAGGARVKSGIDAPAMSGEATFERATRVHMNTVEQLVIFLPGLWMFGYYVNPQYGAGIGLIFIIGRFIYRSAYMADPKKRAVGFLMGVLSMIVLVIGGMIGAGMRLM